MTSVRRSESVLARFLFVAAAVIPSFMRSAQGAVTTTGEVRQPRNIYELVYAFDHTFKKILQADELRLVRTRSPEEIREMNPDLYERISQDVRGWTDEWLQSVMSTVESIPDERLSTVERMAEQVDALLSRHFEARSWPYKRMRVVFLPPRLFHDEHNRGKVTGGMFIPFYPDKFFASVDWPIPMELILVHESLHYNSTGRRFGTPLAEGITETATRHLLLKYGLLTTREVNRQPIYLSERKGVELVLDEIMKRTGGSRDEAVDLFLGAYLTGHQEGMNKIFGVDTWKRVIGLSQAENDWQTHKIKKVLGV